MAKILGFEIKMPRFSAAEPSIVGDVSVQKDLQKTDPSRPLASSFPRAEMGDSGTRLIHGIISEEYNPQLQGIQGIKIYDEMRKSDGTVRAALLSIKLPVRRAEWFIKAADDVIEPRAKEMADFVHKALFEWNDITFDDFIRQALLMTDFGVMIFEKVYGTREDDGKTYVTLEKLAPRLPKSILQWELVDHTFGIQQIRQDGVLAQIPGAKLVIFVNEREGDNWWGTSMLRAAYKHWYFKNNFYKIDAVAFERQGLGVPKIVMPDGYTESDEKKAVKAMQNLRANENAYLLLPPGYEAEFMDMGAHSTRDPEKSINHHNKEILQSVLAQFLELGATRSGSGSRALSEDHSDLFLKGVEAIAKTIIDTTNKDLVRELVDLNFDDVKAYPMLDYSGVSKVDAKNLADAYQVLVTAGAMTPTADDQQFLRSLMGLPARSIEEIEEDEDKEEEEEATAVETEVEPGTNPNEEEGAAAGTKVKKEAPVKKKTKEVAHEHTRRFKRKFDDGNGFMSWRPLTFAEQKVNWAKIEQTMNDLEAELSDSARELLTKSKDSFMAKLHAAIDAGDTKAIDALELAFVSEYKALLKDVMKKAYEYGKSNVSTEMGIAVPPNNAGTLANLDLMAATIAQKTATDLETKAKLAAVNALKGNRSTLQSVGEIDAQLEEAVDTAVDNTAAILVGQVVNMGRNDVFARNIGMIYALQRSELLDAKTCNFCLSMDGLVVEPDDDWASTDVFHSNCRGIWVEILNDETDKPEVTGVPENIGDYYGGQPNSLVQPPRPITRPGTLADAEVKRRAEAKKK